MKANARGGRFRYAPPRRLAEGRRSTAATQEARGSPGFPKRRRASAGPNQNAHLLFRGRSITGPEIAERETRLARPLHSEPERFEGEEADRVPVPLWLELHVRPPQPLEDGGIELEDPPATARARLGPQRDGELHSRRERNCRSVVGFGCRHLDPGAADKPQFVVLRFPPVRAVGDGRDHKHCRRQSCA